MRAGALARSSQSRGRAPSCAGPGKSASSRNQRAASVVAACRSAAGRAGSAGAPIQRRVGAGAPRVALVAAQVVPRGEVGVVVLAAGLEEVRMVGDEHRGDAGVARSGAVIGSSHTSIEPHGCHEEVERAAQEVVARRHARQRAGVVAGEAHRPRARSGRGSACRTRCRRSSPSRCRFRLSSSTTTT